MVGDELRDGDDDARERITIGRLAAADALQYFGGLDAIEHVERVGLTGGRQAEGDVLQHFNQDATKTEGHQLAEGRVGNRADDDFDPLWRELLNLDPNDLGGGV